MSKKVTIRKARKEECQTLGELLVEVYAGIDGFPKPDEQPAYYQMLRNIGQFADKPSTDLIVAVSETGELLGGVVYFDDMKYYGSGGTATQEKNAAGFRLLGVSPKSRGMGLGKLLTQECISRARDSGLEQVIIHTTKSMAGAWKMYEKLGFERSEDLDFVQGDLEVFGFRYKFSDDD